MRDVSYSLVTQHGSILLFSILFKIPSRRVWLQTILLEKRNFDRTATLILVSAEMQCHLLVCCCRLLNLFFYEGKLVLVQIGGLNAWNVSHQPVAVSLHQYVLVRSKTAPDFEVKVVEQW